MIKFKNRPNECKKIDGEILWISRSVAVVGILIFRNITDRVDYVLLEQRSEKMDSPLKWCVPCGYLDWDETGWESLIREVYEETGLYLPSLMNSNSKQPQPYYVNTNPTENKQNVALRYGLHFDVNELPELEVKSDEIKKLRFVDLNDIDEYDMAFNHDKIIKEYANTYVYKYDAI